MNKTKGIIIFLCVILVVATGTVGTRIYEHSLLQNNKKIVKSQSMILKRNVPDLILSSDLIIEGTVEKFLDSKWSNPGLKRGEEIRNILQTDVIIEVSDVLFGNLNGKTVTVRVEGGEDETTIYTCDASPEFTTGEKVLLFLARDGSDVATDEDYYVVTGWYQGKYSINSDSKATSALNNSTYTNKKGTIKPDDLKKQIPEVKAANPNYKAERLQKQKEAEERNKALFGE